jgi:hypothetical protein
VVVRDGRSWVFVLEGGNASTSTVRRVAVNTGRSQDTPAGAQIELTLSSPATGLGPGHVVVVRGAGFLADGDTVQVQPVDRKPMT